VTVGIYKYAFAVHRSTSAQARMPASYPRSRSDEALEPYLPRELRLHAYHPLGTRGWIQVPCGFRSRCSFSSSSRLISRISSMNFFESCSTAACLQSSSQRGLSSMAGFYHIAYLKVRTLACKTKAHVCSPHSLVSSLLISSRVCII
jgi:hypothetical protein